MFHRAVDPSVTSVELSTFDSTIQNSSVSSFCSGAGVNTGMGIVFEDVVSTAAVPLEDVAFGEVELDAANPVAESVGLPKADMIGTLGDSLKSSRTGAANPGISSGVAALYDGPYP